MDNNFWLFICFSLNFMRKRTEMIYSGLGKDIVCRLYFKYKKYSVETMCISDIKYCWKVWLKRYKKYSWKICFRIKVNISYLETFLHYTCKNVCSIPNMCWKQLWEHQTRQRIFVTITYRLFRDVCGNWNDLSNSYC